MGQLEDMQAFVRIVDAGGIGLAAEQMGIAKSAVSRRLSELEARLGVSLLNRTTRSSKLTEAGENYYTRSQQLISDIEELNNLTTDPDCSLNGTLRISVPLSFGVTHLSSALDSFSKEHPNLNLDITFTDREADLIEGGYDLAFRIGNLENSSLRARKISPIRLVICASPAYLAKNGTPKTAEDLKHHNILKYSIADSHGWKLIDEKGHTHKVPIKSNMTANNGDFLTAMSVANRGLILIPTFIVWKHLANGDLISILTNYQPPEINAYVVYPQVRTASRKVRLFIDFLTERFGEKPYWDDKL